MNKKVKFECNGCGGCCHGGISLTLEEYLTYNYNDFPVQLCVSVYDSRNLIEPEFPKSRLKEQKNYLSKNILFFTKSPDGRKIAVIPELVSLVPQGEPCPNLDELFFCKIYPRKPLVCGLYPYRIDKEQGSTLYGLMHEKARAIEGEGLIPCEGFTESAPVYFSGEPVDNTVYSRLKERSEQAAKFKNQFKDYFLHRMKDEAFSEEIVQNCHFNSPTGKRIRMSFAEFLCFSDKQQYGILTSVTKSYIESNMNMLERQFENLIDKKDGIYKKFCAEMQLEAINHLRVLNEE